MRESNGSGGLLRRYLHGNDLISQDTSAASSYYHHDGIGSVVATTSDSGVPQRTYSYEPFGKEHLSLTLDPTAPDNLMRFTGELFDRGTGLYHLRARQYDPGLGRFTTRDPLAPMIKDPYIASYVYARNSPTSLVDRNGLSATQDALAYINAGVSGLALALNLGSLLGSYDALLQATLLSFVSTFVAMASVWIAFAEEESGTCIANQLTSYLGSSLLSLTGAIPGTGLIFRTAKVALSGVGFDQSIRSIDSVSKSCRHEDVRNPEPPVSPSSPDWEK